MTQINLAMLQQQFEPLTRESLKEYWGRLHAGDCETWPDTQEHQDAWLLFHNGKFQDAANAAAQCPALKSLQLKALATYAHYIEKDPEEKIRQFLSTVELAETALHEAEENIANVCYQIAYSLGRYGQFISVAKALAEGIAGKIEKALKRSLENEPNHADAHTALATYQAEIIGKLGKMAAKLTYGVSGDDSIEHYEKGMSLAPFSISAKTEYADGILTMFGKKRLKNAVALYQEAAAIMPVDALEAMDVQLAIAELNDA